MSSPLFPRPMGLRTPLGSSLDTRSRQAVKLAADAFLDRRRPTRKLNSGRNQMANSTDSDQVTGSP